jgi:hypothetical protein
VGLATARELVEQIVDPINEELERLQLKPNEFLELPIKEDTAGEKAETLTPEEMRQIYLALRVELSPQDADRILSKIETIQKEVERK